MQNLFTDSPTNLPEELVEVLAQTKHVRIERIVSHGHAGPDDFWCDQKEQEWVVVLKGEAKLIFEGDGDPIHMRPGDRLITHSERIINLGSLSELPETFPQYRLKTHPDAHRHWFR